MRFLRARWLVALVCAAALTSAPSAAIELESIAKAAANYTHSNAALQAMYRAALLNTSRQATANDGTAYVKTGDIRRGMAVTASAQVRPLDLRQERSGGRVARGMIARMGKLCKDRRTRTPSRSTTACGNRSSARLARLPITLAWTYWKQTGDTSIFTGDLSLGFDKALETMEREQDHPRNQIYAPQPDANRQRQPSATQDDLGGRPSDDAVHVQFLIPSEMMAVVALGGIGRNRSATSTTT